VESVFLLWFVRAADTPEEDPLFIGVYQTEQDAESAIKRLRTQRGFIDDPTGFQICPYEINKDHWTEGFIVD
jgi:hypothetical protein